MLIGAASACSAGGGSEATSGGRHGIGDAGGAGGSGGSAGDGGVLIDASYEACVPLCADDGRSYTDCNGQNVACADTDSCTVKGCAPACDAARANKSSVGCEYRAVMMDGIGGATDGCFVAFVANTFGTPAHLTAKFGAAALDLAAYARVPTGSGPSLHYGAYDPVAGLAPGEVAILFLAGNDANGGVACPVPTAVPTSAQVTGTGLGTSFLVSSDVPVVAYQMLPYGGGSAAVTGATLLLPTSAWGTNYVAVNAYAQSQAAGTNPSLDIVAAEDDTSVIILPRADIAGGSGVASAAANQPATYVLSAGQVLQLTQPAELTGSPVESNKPIGLFAGHACLNVPASVAYCDHAEQAIPPVRAMGGEYVGVTYRQRSARAEHPPWRVIGAVDGTTLTWDPPVGGPATLDLGQVAEFTTTVPFVVTSQDAAHPFLLFTYMTGSQSVQDGYGDADFVRIVAAKQYLSRYVFFTDPTYPETNLVVVRRATAGAFADVSLDCAGVLTGWTPVGSAGTYEYTRIDLVRHDFQPQGACNNGRHEMHSDGPFGLWVWGWGTPETGIATINVSYGYPAGENVQPLNDIVVPPVPH